MELLTFSVPELARADKLPMDIDEMLTHPLRGHIFETFILSEMVKSKLNRGEKPAFTFWRDSNGNEVDLLEDTGSKLIPIEIKSGRTLTHESYSHKGIKVAGWKNT